MGIKKLSAIILNNWEKFIVQCCFWGMLSFNALIFCLLCYHMFNYNGGINDPKSYYEIITIEMAHNAFLKEMVETWMHGILFSFPLIWSCFFVRSINLNAILVQIFPLVISIGLILFNL